MDHYWFAPYELCGEKLYHQGAEVPLEPKVSQLLRVLVTRAGELVTQDELKSALWPTGESSDSALYYTVSMARKALAQCEKPPISLIRGRGYRFDAGVRAMPSASPLVGRSQELSDLDSLLAKVTRKQTPALAIVTGAPGIGKTALTKHFTERARRHSARCVFTSCFDQAVAPAFWPWDAIWQGVSGEMEGGVWTPPAETSPSDLVVRPANLPEIRRARTQQALNRLRQVSATTSWVLAFDDLHLASEETVELLTFLCSSTLTGPILFLATSRPEADSDRPDLNELFRLATVLKLGPLGGGAALALLRANAKEGALPEVERSLIDLAGGNPLFLCELGRMAAENGLDHVSLPSGIRAAIDSHVKRLPTISAALLEHASVIGRRFDASLLALCRADAIASVVDGLSPAVEAGILRRRSASEYEFSHDLYHLHLYESQEPNVRIERHKALAKALRSAGIGALRVEVGDVARHACAGAVSPKDCEQAATESERAGHRYASQFAYQAASQHFQNAVTYGTRAHRSTRAQVHAALRLSEALWHSAQGDRAQRVADEAIEQARGAEDPVLLAQTVLAKGRLSVDLYGNGSLEPLISEALHRLPGDQVTLKAQLLARQAEELNLSPHRYQAEGLARESLRLAEGSGDPTTLARSRYAYAISTWGVLQHKHGWGEILLAAQRAAETAKDTHLELKLRALIATHALESGEVERSAAMAKTLEHDSKTLSFPLGIYLMKLRDAALAIFRGDRSAPARIAEAFEDGRRVVPGMAQQMQVGQQVLMACETGPQRVSSDLDPLATIVSDGPLMAFAAFTAALARDPHAKRVYQAASEVLDGEKSENSLTLPAYSLLAELDAWHASSERANRSYDRLSPFAGRVALTGCTSCIMTLVDFALGKLAKILGDPSRAAQHFAAARELAERLESPTWVRRCRAQAELTGGRTRGGLPLR
jgi:DNA-binding winged helix-turn-helix (wHTH) protein